MGKLWRGCIKPLHHWQVQPFASPADPAGILLDGPLRSPAPSSPRGERGLKMLSVFLCGFF